ncbi:MAG: hypothetical protein A3F11_10390 [Gammaproteobacteria bacterium RIFCSPHIGHO2_12_FULL_37_14]|nr:MAG: hypothetical protein A3F11_10390 [Gammaproteobacteria bacterium RIFCSPHIGHO2_12_FULL_37_14]
MKRSEFLDLLKKNNQQKLLEVVDIALEKNEDLNHYEDVTEFTHTPLLDSVTEGNEFAVSSLLATQKVLVDGNGWGYSPLMIASAKGFINIIQKLLAYQANLNYEVEWSQNSARAIQIIRTNRTHIRTSLFNMLKENRHCATDTAETLAVRHGHLDVLKLISGLKAGELDLEDNALVCLAAQENQLPILIYFESLGYKLNKPNAKNEMPILLAARYAAFETVQYLLTREISQQNIHDALKEALNQRDDVTKYLEIIELLIAADKNINEPFIEKDEDGRYEPSTKSLMDYAAERLEVPDTLGGFTSNSFSFLVPDNETISVIYLLLEAGVARLSSPISVFSDGARFKNIVDAYQALKDKGLNAKEIAAQIFEKFSDINVKDEPSSELNTMTPEERMEALVNAVKPADIQRNSFLTVVVPLVSFFESKSAMKDYRKEKASKSSAIPQTLFLRTLKDGLLYSKPEKDLVVEESPKERSAANFKM